MDMFLITKILDLAYVQNYMRCLSQNSSVTKLFRVYYIKSLYILREDSDNYYIMYIKHLTFVLQNAS